MPYEFGSSSLIDSLNNNPYDLDPAVLRRIIAIESGGDPNARTGSYKGLFQLSNDEFNRYGGGNIYDAQDNTDAALRKLSAERDWFAQNYGRNPSATDLYLMHQQGQGGYAMHLANPDSPAWQNMLATAEGRQKGPNWAKQAIWGNIPDNLKDQYGDVNNVSSQDFMDLWRNKVEGDGGDIQAAALGTGRRRMADTSRGMLGILDPTAPREDQRPQGLLGTLGDPESIAYLAMISKAFNPWSQMNPEQLLIQAQRTRESQAQRAMDRYYRDQELRLRQQEYYDKQDVLRRQRQAYESVYGGGQPQPSQMPVAPITAAPLTGGQEAEPAGLPTPQEADTGRTAAPPDTTAAPLTTTGGLTLDLPKVTQALRNPYLDPTTRSFMQAEYNRLTASQKIGQDVAEKRRLAELPLEQGGLGLEKGSPEWQQYVAGIKPAEKALPPQAARSLTAAQNFLARAPEIERAISNGELTGPINAPLARGGIGNKGTLFRAMQEGVDALRTRGSPVNENNYLPAITDTQKTLLAKHKALTEALQGLEGNLLRGRGPSESTRSDRSPFGMGGGSLPEGWTVKVRP